MMNHHQKTIIAILIFINLNNKQIGYTLNTPMHHSHDGHNFSMLKFDGIGIMLKRENGEWDIAKA